MRLIVSALAFSVVLLGLATVGAADESPCPPGSEPIFEERVVGDRTVEVLVGCTEVPVPDDPAESEGPDLGDGEPVEDPCDTQHCYRVVHLRAGTNSDGTPCIREVVIMHTAFPTEAQEYTGIGMFVIVEYSTQWWLDAYALLGQTPGDCDGLGPPPLQPTPEDITDALQAVVPETLPAPALEVDPGEVLTGLPAYLEAQWDDEPAPHDSDCQDIPEGTPSHLIVEDDDEECQELLDDIRLHIGGLELDLQPFGTFDVQLDATARYVVDWGDGETTEARAEGFPYPEGVVRHTYQSVPPEGEVTISIQEYWTVTWTVQGFGSVQMPGEITPPPTSETVPIREMQAVVTSESGA